MSSAVLRLARIAVAAIVLAPLCGCAVITVAGAAASVAATGASLAVDAAVGTVRLTGAAVGAAAGAVLPDSD
ncbi:MAG TPA: hypothetical protein VIL30_10200 [Ramlibacter sp.]|jgi:hypothetical protein